jgi:hypothetical protein
MQMRFLLPQRLIDLLKASVSSVRHLDRGAIEGVDQLPLFAGGDGRVLRGRAALPKLPSN